MMDRNVGDMFLNFQLHDDARPYMVVVALTCLQDPPGKGGPNWAVWDRNLMGFAASPYNSIKMVLVAEEVCRGDRRGTRLRITCSYSIITVTYGIFECWLAITGFLVFVIG